MRYLKLFQQKYKLKPDGVFGPNTLRKLSEVLNIRSKEHLAHFLGQVHVETGGFHSGRESMNYSVKDILGTFSSRRISKEQALKYCRTANQPADEKAIANIVYGGAWGLKNLGNTQPMDGWFFRGNGAIQLTGRYNHQLFANYIKMPTLMQNPDLIMSDYYFESGVFFFNKKKIWDLCNVVTKEVIADQVSEAINLGRPNHPGVANHVDKRVHWTFHYYTLLQTIEL
tara:strand:+ start:15218 stop:15898 length:681 start_codon:yes stop_codon:yes gene_type:complete